jgi:hypothetical protein
MMAKVKAGIPYDVTHVETRSGEHAKPGTYTVEITEAEQREEKADGSPANDIRLRLDFVDDGDDYMPLFTYVGLSGASEWKLKELVKAVGLPEKGSLQTSKLEGKKIRVKVVADQYEGNYTARAGNLLPLKGSENGASATASADEETYEDWSLEDLKAEADERGLEVKGRVTEAKLIDALLEDDASQDGGAEAGVETEDDYDDWSLDDLKAEAEEKGIMGNITGRKTKEKIIEALRSISDEAEVVEPEDDYDDWETAELKEEVVDRKLELPKGRLSKDKLIAMLREDDGTDPFTEGE